MSFGTVINCMDGRVQNPVNAHLRELWGVEHVDTITEPGPDGILGRGRPRALLNSILDRVALSVERHGSRHIALVAHHDCAGNPCDRETHLELLQEGLRLLAHHFPGASVLGLWVGPAWTVEEVSPAG